MGQTMLTKLDDNYFKKFRELIYNASGMTFTEINRPILDSRIADLLRGHGNITVDEYYKVVSRDTDELNTLLDSVTTNLTSFFRNLTQLNSFRDEVLDDIIKTRPTHRLKVWSAGCSTGEEPYTLAMILSEKLGPGWNVEIVASDISFSVLMKASQGFYQTNRITGIPDDLLKKYFIKSGDGYQVCDKLKKMIRFDYHNLKNDSGMRDFDVVFCRNVIIYFDQAAQENVIQNIYRCMNKHSYLFLGHSESLLGMKTPFEFVKFGSSCLYMKKE